MIRKPDLPLGRDRGFRLLSWMTGALVFLCLLLLSLAIGLQERLQGTVWEQEHRILVQVPGHLAPEEKDRLAALVQDTARKQAPEAKVNRLGLEAMIDHLSPWLGNDESIALLPLPVSFEIDTSALNAEEHDALYDTLDKAAPALAISSREEWAKHFLTLARYVIAACWGFGGVTLLLTLLLVALVTSMGFHLHRQAIDLLHQMGAKDNYIASQFTRHAMRHHLMGALPAILLAVLTLLSVGFALATPGEGSGSGFDALPAGIPVVLLGVPLVTLAMAALVSQSCALRLLKRLP